MLHFWLLLHPVDPKKKPLNIGPYPPKSHLKPLDSTEILGFSGNHGHFIQFQSLLSPAPWLHPGMVLVPAYDVDASRLVSFFHQNQDLRRNSMNAYLRKSGNLALLKNWTNGTWKMMAFCRIFRWTCLVGNRTLWPKASPACVPGLCRVGLRRTICKPEAPSNRILHKIRLLLGGSFDSRQGSSQWEPSQKKSVNLVTSQFSAHVAHKNGVIWTVYQNNPFSCQPNTMPKCQNHFKCNTRSHHNFCKNLAGLLSFFGHLGSLTVPCLEDTSPQERARSWLEKVSNWFAFYDWSCGYMSMHMYVIYLYIY